MVESAFCPKNPRSLTHSSKSNGILIADELNDIQIKKSRQQGIRRRVLSSHKQQATWTAIYIRTYLFPEIPKQPTSSFGVSHHDMLDPYLVQIE
mgnify:CR=1 FL=1